MLLLRLIFCTIIDYSNISIMNEQNFLHQIRNEDNISTTQDYRKAMNIRLHRQPHNKYILEAVGSNGKVLTSSQTDDETVKLKKWDDGNPFQVFELEKTILKKYHIKSNGENKCLSLLENQLSTANCDGSIETTFSIGNYNQMGSNHSVNEKFLKKIGSPFYIWQGHQILNQNRETRQLLVQKKDEYAVEVIAIQDGNGYKIMSMKEKRFLDSSDPEKVQFNMSSDNSGQLYEIRPVKNDEFKIVSDLDNQCLSIRNEMLVKENCSSTNYQVFKAGKKSLDLSIAYYLALVDSKGFFALDSKKEFVTLSESKSLASKFVFEERINGFTVIFLPEKGQFVTLIGDIVGFSKDKPALFQVKKLRENFVMIRLANMCMTYVVGSSRLSMRECKGGYEQIFEKFTKKEDRDVARIERIKQKYGSLEKYVETIKKEFNPDAHSLRDTGLYVVDKDDKPSVSQNLDLSSTVKSIANDPVNNSLKLVKNGSTLAKKTIEKQKRKLRDKGEQIAKRKADEQVNLKNKKIKLDLDLGKRKPVTENLLRKNNGKPNLSKYENSKKKNLKTYRRRNFKNSSLQKAHT